jgi:hypothetical protein
MIVNLANNPLLLERGIIDNGLERTEDDFDFERWGASVSWGTGSIVPSEECEWMESSSVSSLFEESSSWSFVVETPGWVTGPSMSWGT